MPIYLDNAATSFPKPDCVYDAVDDFMRNNGSAFGRSSHGAGTAATQMVSQCRHRIAQLLDAESDDRIAFTFNCTDGLNLLLHGLLNSGDRVVTTTLEHNSVLRPLQQLTSQIGLDVSYTEFDAASGIVDVERLIGELKRIPTRLLILNHASNVTGAIQPVKEIAAAAREFGTLVLLDAAQTTGHFPFSVRELGVDLLAAAGHKGLLGPLGTGIIYVRKGLDAKIRCMRSGGTGTFSESLEQPVEMPGRFESGNLNMPGIAGLNAAVKWIDQRGLREIHDQSCSLTRALYDGLAALNGVSIVGVADTPNTGVVSFSVTDLDCRDVATILDQSFEIQCRAGLHCAPLAHERLGTLQSGGTVRLSPGAFTTELEITAAIEALAAIAGM